ncbi:MAG: hypothetical protein ABR605_04105, partial [Desulfurivibrionaceae bacterium]
LILLANGVAFIASERSVSGKLKWPVTLLTLLFMALWSFKVFAPLGRGEPVPAHVYPDWLAPFLISFVGLYLAFYVGRYIKKAKATVYDAVIPSLNVLLFFGAGGVIVRDYWQQPWLFGLFSLTLALGLAVADQEAGICRRDGRRLCRRRFSNDRGDAGSRRQCGLGDSDLDTVRLRIGASFRTWRKCFYPDIVLSLSGFCPVDRIGI